MDDFNTDDFIPMENEITIEEQLTRLPKVKKPKKRTVDDDQIKNLYDVVYDYITMKYYVARRISRSDPITDELFNKNDPKAFIYKYMWDPYTGDKLGEDPYGPLYFNPMAIIKNIHVNRLNNLYCQPTDETGGQYEGRYDDAMGAGDDGFVVSRGFHPEWYLFRLPIPNGYLTPEHNHQFITMGPKLSIDELIEIEGIAIKYWSAAYKKEYGAPMPSLLDMYAHYTQAININPLNEGDWTEDSDCTREEAIYKANAAAVDLLRKMKG